MTLTANRHSMNWWNDEYDSWFHNKHSQECQVNILEVKLNWSKRKLIWFNILSHSQLNTRIGQYTDALWNVNLKSGVGVICFQIRDESRFPRADSSKSFSRQHKTDLFLTLIHARHLQLLKDYPLWKSDNRLLIMFSRQILILISSNTKIWLCSFIAIEKFHVTKLKAFFYISENK